MNRYKKTYNLFFLLLLFVSVSQCTCSTAIEVRAPQKTASINILVGIVGKKNKQLIDVATVLQKDLGFTEQLAPTVHSFASLSSKKTIASLLHQGFPLALFLSWSDRKKAINYRLYDTSQVKMIVGKKYRVRGSVARGWAHAIADRVWPLLIGQEGFFSTKIAYAKEIRQSGRRAVKHICVADYDGSNEQVVVATPTVNIAPQFNKDPHNPLLFFSESTNENIRLMYIDQKGRKKVASDFDGVNMLPSFSSNGKQVVYCASKGKGSCQLYYCQKNDFRNLTQNTSNNLSPSLDEERNRVFYCSDEGNGRPHIYAIDLSDGSRTRITRGSASFCPQYCTKNKKLAYTKMIKGIAQLFVYDEATQKHQQVTFDLASKDSCSWSPCGNFLLYSVDGTRGSKISLVNLITKKQQILSVGRGVTYPTWSPRYEAYPQYNITKKIAVKA